MPIILIPVIPTLGKDKTKLIYLLTKDTVVEYANELCKGIYGMVNDLAGDRSARELGISTSVELV
ncbi:hypothetical protein EJ419_03330 [Alloscardovia theropitheci]|uniref:Uncharacterized protein n=1 Tax=Alloscardovia theropitheci TaxID=2496842 RepID=A0A4R0R0B7_9BIFI|nr:hypothetical protein [Alloscardovia theropitheci]TCD54456.1 hypothetical protein EJ419_03330 [Alloscardovia theropitheci]